LAVVGVGPFTEHAVYLSAIRTNRFRSEVENIVLFVIG